MDNWSIALYSTTSSDVMKVVDNIRSLAKYFSLSGISGRSLLDMCEANNVYYTINSECRTLSSKKDLLNAYWDFYYEHDMVTDITKIRLCDLDLDELIKSGKYVSVYISDEPNMQFIVFAIKFPLPSSYTSSF